MSAEEKTIVQNIAEAVSALPSEKREFIMGYAEGVIAMAEQLRCGGQRPAEQANT